MEGAPQRNLLDIDQLAQELLAALLERRSMEPVTDRQPAFDTTLAYSATEAIRRLRERRGERVVGRKIGFTNRTIWAEYRVDAPIWGYVYDTTLQSIAEGARFDLGAFLEPRIEPEIAFGLGRPPEPGMDERALLSTVDWVAHGFEIVQSIYPGWRFRAPDTVAAFGLHGALLLGDPEPITPANFGEWLERLASFEIVLMRDGAVADEGRAENVLGGPLTALRHFVDLLARLPGCRQLQAGEVVTTGTLTRALPVASGETWNTRLKGLPLAGLQVSFR